MSSTHKGFQHHYRDAVESSTMINTRETPFTDNAASRELLSLTREQYGCFFGTDVTVDVMFV